MSKVIKKAIVKYLRKKNTEDVPKKYVFMVISTRDNDPRGFTLDGEPGKFLQVINNFEADEGKNILSMSPLTNPALANYEEFSEEEAIALIATAKQKKVEQLAKQKVEDKTSQEVAEAAEVARVDKLVALFEEGKLYEGDVDVFKAAHGFTPAEHEAKKKAAKDKKDKELTKPK